MTKQITNLNENDVYSKQGNPQTKLNEFEKGSYHSNVRVVTEAGLADDRKVGAFPAIGLQISKQPMRHVRLCSALAQNSGSPTLIGSLNSLCKALKQRTFYRARARK